MSRRLAIVLLLVFPESVAWGYRPFIATDAAVADPREIEIELGYFTLQREHGENAFVIPRAVLNYGLFQNWEAVAEFAVLRLPSAELNVIDPALSLKGVLREGVLQDKEGPSVALEAALLLPSTEHGECHFGFEGTAILSDKLGPFMFHLNGGLGIERSTGELVGTWGAIGELAVGSGLRLVGEVDGEKPRRQEQSHSALLGFIWQPRSSQNLWFDAGIRRRLSGAGPDWQFTFGLTFGFSAASVAQRLVPLFDSHGASGERGER